MSQYESNYYGSGGAGYVQGGSPFSQGGSPGGRKTEASLSLRPFTIAQLIKASQAHTDSEWRVDDIEVGQVTIVGEVISIQQQATNHVYIIDDGTGTMEARQWIASDESTESKENATGKQFVRVVGGLKSFGKKRYVNINHIRPVTDGHEVYFHILEAMTVSLIVERGPPSSTMTAPQTNLDGRSTAPQTGRSASPYSTLGNTAKSEYAHLPPLQRRILEFIANQPRDDEGVDVGNIAKAVAGHDAHQISAALDHLMEEGAVYTTVDDSHFHIST